jgi:hypothetical protein
VDEGLDRTPGAGDGTSFQPGYQAVGYPMPYGQPPPSHLVWAWIAAVGGVIFNLLLGFPSAMVAIRHARRVRSTWESGDQQAALRESRKARTWAIVSTVLDVVGVILVIALIAGNASTQNFGTPSVAAASIKTQLQKRFSDPTSQFYQPGLKVTSVVCTAVGAHTDHCVDHFSNGQVLSETIVISANGDSYMTR